MGIDRVAPDTEVGASTSTSVSLVVSTASLGNTYTNMGSTTSAVNTSAVGIDIVVTSTIEVNTTSDSLVDVVVAITSLDITQTGISLAVFCHTLKPPPPCHLPCWY